MTKRIKITFIALLVAVISCLGVGIAFSKYIKDDLNVGSFRVNIVASFSGIVTNEEELEEVKKTGKDFTVKNGGESYSEIEITNEYVSDDGIKVTIENVVTTGKITADGAGVNIEINGLDATQVNENGVVTVKNGATIIVNDATITGYPNISGTVYVGGNSTLIINGGNYDRWILAMGDGSSTLIINGGTFTGLSYIDGFMGMMQTVGTVKITGGTFNIDPSNYVADGYVAVNNDGTWIVQTA